MDMSLETVLEWVGVFTRGDTGKLDEVIAALQTQRANATGQDTRSYLEHEVSRLRECRDTWKAQAESLANRRHWNYDEAREAGK